MAMCRCCEPARRLRLTPSWRRRPSAPRGSGPASSKWYRRAPARPCALRYRMIGSRSGRGRREHPHRRSTFPTVDAGRPEMTLITSGPAFVRWRSATISRSASSPSRRGWRRGVERRSPSAAHPPSRERRHSRYPVARLAPQAAAAACGPSPPSISPTILHRDSIEYRIRRGGCIGCIIPGLLASCGLRHPQGSPEARDNVSRLAGVWSIQLAPACAARHGPARPAARLRRRSRCGSPRPAASRRPPR